MARSKRFKLAASEIRPLVRGIGGCIASDKITVGGEPVGYMLREEPSRPEDSGWLFTSGTETQAYMDDPANFEVYDVNTIANYDRDILPFLHAPAGSAFERPENRGDLQPCEGTDWPGDDSYAKPQRPWPPPGFPLVEGVHALSRAWWLTLPEPFARRVEDGSLVLWRPGLTLWINQYTNDRGESQATRLVWMKEAMSPEATEISETTSAGLTRLTYRLREDEVESLTALVVADAGHLQVGIYFDDPTEAPLALQLARSIASGSPPS